MRKVLLLLKHIEKKIIIAMYFKNEEEAYNWWTNFIASEEWEIIHEGKRSSKSGHRWEITYSKFDEQGELYTKYIICFSKNEAVILEQKIKKENPNYITKIKKLY